MAQISTANLQTLLDKIARHVAEANGDVLASAVATGAVYTVTTPNAGLIVGNADVLAALNTLVDTTIADADLSGLIADEVDELVAQNPALVRDYWTKVVDGLDHYGRLNNALLATDRGGLDAMLRVLNASTPTLRAHFLFEKYFGRLSPANVFVATPFTLATLVVTGADAATFAHVAALDTTLYAPGKLAILNTKGEGLTSTVLTLTCTKAGVATSVAFTVTTQTDKYLTAGADTDKRFTDCTAKVSISGGNNGDEFSVVILPDRAISAA